jgi:CheY-like chemotaxis protein
MNSFMTPDTPALHLLIVEDYPDAAQILAEMLRMAGYDVSFAMTPAQAIADALQHPPDVVISDIGLPGRDGCVLAREIVEVTGTMGKGRPLMVAVSGQGGDIESRCRDAGFDYFFHKPASPAALENLLHTYAQKAPGFEAVP